MFKHILLSAILLMLVGCNAKNVDQVELGVKDQPTNNNTVQTTDAVRLQNMFLLNSGRKTVYIHDSEFVASLYLRFSIYGQTTKLNSVTLSEPETTPSKVSAQTVAKQKALATTTNESPKTTAIPHVNDKELVFKHFHIIHGAFSAFERMRFAIASRPENTDLRLNTQKRSQGWSVERINTVLSEKDWFSAVWITHGKEVPAKWLAKKYIFSIPNRKRRVIYEYREFYPECMPVFDAQTEVLNAQSVAMRTAVAQQCLDDFSDRADAFFSGVSGDNNLDITLTKDMDKKPDLSNIEIFTPQSTQTIPFNTNILGSFERIDKDDTLF